MELAHKQTEAEMSYNLQLARLETLREWVVSFQYDSQGLRTRIFNGVSSSLSSSAKAGEKQTSQLKGSQAERWELSLPIPFCMKKASNDWMRPTHIGESYALLNLLMQMLISPRNTLTNTSRIMFNQISGHPMMSLR